MVLTRSQLVRAGLHALDTVIPGAFGEVVAQIAPLAKRVIRGPEGRRGAGRDVARIGGGAHGDGRDIEGELTYLGKGFIALVVMIGTLAGLTGGFLALLAFRLAGGTDSCCSACNVTRCRR